MKPFSLLQSLADAPAKAAVAKAVADSKANADTKIAEAAEAAVAAAVAEAAAQAEKSYLIYVIESEAGTVKVGVPVDNVSAFDAYFESQPEHLSAIQEHLAAFEAIIVE
jgi:hypothetical protein